MSIPPLGRNSSFNLNNRSGSISGDPGLSRVAQNISKNLQRDRLVQRETDNLRQALEVDRVVLYYFYRQWKGQVTFESLSDRRFSILGTTGADECFNDEYAAMYLEGRVRAIADIETEPIHECHRQFLRGIGVRANLVVPILTAKGLWGLFVAHHCQSPRSWSGSDLKTMQTSARILATADAIQ
ncbi:MAG: GAF domain-containing protein [Cyanobacteriota bacterium]|nr:GAF domain-containing protein [Cyanobacteriota bacterium]